MQPFTRELTFSLSAIIKAEGIDAFDDLVEERLGHGIADAAFTPTGVTPSGDIMITITGFMFNEEEI